MVRGTFGPAASAPAGLDPKLFRLAPSATGRRRLGLEEELGGPHGHGDWFAKLNLENHSPGRTRDLGGVPFGRVGLSQP